MRTFSRLIGVHGCGGWVGWMAFGFVFAVSAAIVASGAPFVSAVADVVAIETVGRATDLDRAVTVRADAHFGSGLGEATRAVEAALDDVAGLEFRATTLAVGGNRTGARRGENALNGFVRIVARDGAMDALEVVSGGGREGVWISERAARFLGAAPGDAISVGDAGFRVDLPVSAVYRDLDLLDLGPYWSLVPRPLQPREYRVFGDVVQPELLVVARDTLLRLGAFSSDDLDAAGGPDAPASEVLLGAAGFVWWQAAAGPVGSAAELRRLAADVRAFERSANDPTAPLGAALRGAGISRVLMETSVADLNAEVSSAVRGIEPAIVPIRVAGALLGLAVVAVGAWFVAGRRVRDVRLAIVEGLPAWQVGAAASAAAVLPALLGGAAGASLGPLVVFAAGPSTVFHGGGAPIRPVIAFVAAGLLVVGLVTGASAYRVMAGQLGPARRWAADLALYAVAVILLVQVMRRDPARTTAGELDLASALLPIAASAALVVAGARAVAGLLGRVRRRGGGLPVGLFLAWRRLAAAAAGRHVAVVPIGAAVGVAVFSAFLVSSVDAGLGLKASVAVGSDVTARLGRVNIPETVPDGMTLMWTGSATRGGSSRATLIVIDTATYAGAVHWDDSFGVSVDELAALLDDPADRVPVIATGPGATTLPREGSVRTQGLDVGYRIVAHADALPRMADRRPTMLVSRDALLRWAAAFPEAIRLPDPERRSLLIGLSPELTTRRSVAEVRSFLVAAGLPTGLIETRAELLADATLSAQRWAFDYLRLLAAAALALSFAVLGFAMVEARRRLVVAHSLATRMGMRRRTSAAALGVEIAAVVGLAVTLGMLGGWLLAALVLGRFDPLPALPPDLPLAVPAGAFAVVAIIAALGGATVWAATQRATVRADVAEVLRVG